MMTLPVALILCVGTAAAQPSFEVSVIKLSPMTIGFPQFVMDGGPGTEDPGRITYRNVTLRNMLEAAYDLRSYQIIGPGWIDSQRFDVTATIPKGTSVEEFRVMLQALLRERLRMTVHHEQRPTRMYALVIAQGGLKMKESTEPDSQSSAPRRNPSATAQGMLHMGGVRSGIGSIAQLASRQLGDPVLDFTGLKGRYDYSLDYAPTNGRLPLGPMGTPGPIASPSDNPDNLDIFRAFEEQLGLRLEARKAPVDTLVVDKADQSPIE